MKEKNKSEVSKNDNASIGSLASADNIPKEDQQSVKAKQAKSRQLGNHNRNEKLRKAKLNSLIMRLRDMVPGMLPKESKNSILEKVCDYVIHLKDTNKQLEDGHYDDVKNTEISNMKKKIECLELKNKKYLQMLKNVKINNIENWSKKAKSITSRLMMGDPSMINLTKECLDNDINLTSSNDVDILKSAVMETLPLSPGSLDVLESIQTTPDSTTNCVSETVTSSTISAPSIVLSSPEKNSSSATTITNINTVNTSAGAPKLKIFSNAQKKKQGAKNESGSELIATSSSCKSILSSVSSDISTQSSSSSITIVTTPNSSVGVVSQALMSNVQTVNSGYCASGYGPSNSTELIQNSTPILSSIIQPQLPGQNLNCLSSSVLQPQNNTIILGQQPGVLLGQQMLGNQFTVFNPQPFVQNNAQVFPQLNSSIVPSVQPFVQQLNNGTAQTVLPTVGQVGQNLMQVENKNQFATAFLLPNGQILPVVTQSSVLSVSSSEVNGQLSSVISSDVGQHFSGSQAQTIVIDSNSNINQQVINTNIIREATNTVSTNNAPIFISSQSSTQQSSFAQIKPKRCQRIIKPKPSTSETVSNLTSEAPNPEVNSNTCEKSDDNDILARAAESIFDSSNTISELEKLNSSINKDETPKKLPQKNKVDDAPGHNNEKSTKIIEKRKSDVVTESPSPKKSKVHVSNPITTPTSKQQICPINTYENVPKAVTSISKTINQNVEKMDSTESLKVIETQKPSNQSSGSKDKQESDENLVVIPSEKGKHSSEISIHSTSHKIAANTEKNLLQNIPSEDIFECNSISDDSITRNNPNENGDASQLIVPGKSPNNVLVSKSFNPKVPNAEDLVSNREMPRTDASNSKSINKNQQQDVQGALDTHSFSKESSTKEASNINQSVDEISIEGNDLINDQDTCTQKKSTHAKDGLDEISFKANDSANKNSAINVMNLVQNDTESDLIESPERLSTEYFDSNNQISKSTCVTMTNEFTSISTNNNPIESTDKSSFLNFESVYSSINSKPECQSSRNNLSSFLTDVININSTISNSNYSECSAPIVSKPNIGSGSLNNKDSGNFSKTSGTFSTGANNSINSSCNNWPVTKITSVAPVSNCVSTTMVNSLALSNTNSSNLIGSNNHADATTSRFSNSSCISSVGAMDSGNSSSVSRCASENINGFKKISTSASNYPYVKSNGNTVDTQNSNPHISAPTLSTETPTNKSTSPCNQDNTELSCLSGKDKSIRASESCRPLMEKQSPTLTTNLPSKSPRPQSVHAMDNSYQLPKSNLGNLTDLPSNNTRTTSCNVNNELILHATNDCISNSPAYPMASHQNPCKENNSSRILNMDAFSSSICSYSSVGAQISSSSSQMTMPHVISTSSASTLCTTSSSPDTNPSTSTGFLSISQLTNTPCSMSLNELLTSPTMPDMPSVVSNGNDSNSVNSPFSSIPNLPLFSASSPDVGAQNPNKNYYDAGRSNLSFSASDLINSNANALQNKTSTSIGTFSTDFSNHMIDQNQVDMNGFEKQPSMFPTIIHGNKSENDPSFNSNKYSDGRNKLNVGALNQSNNAMNKVNSSNSIATENQKNSNTMDTSTTHSMNVPNNIQRVRESITDYIPNVNELSQYHHSNLHINQNISSEKQSNLTHNIMNNMNQNPHSKVTSNVMSQNKNGPGMCTTSQSHPSFDSRNIYSSVNFSDVWPSNNHQETHSNFSLSHHPRQTGRVDKHHKTRQVSEVSSYHGWMPDHRTHTPSSNSFSNTSVNSHSNFGYHPTYSRPSSTLNYQTSHSSSGIHASNTVSPNTTRNNNNNIRGPHVTSNKETSSPKANNSYVRLTPTSNQDVMNSSNTSSKSMPYFNSNLPTYSRGHNSSLSSVYSAEALISDNTNNFNQNHNALSTPYVSGKRIPHSAESLITSTSSVQNGVSSLSTFNFQSLNTVVSTNSNSSHFNPGLGLIPRPRFPGFPVPGSSNTLTPVTSQSGSTADDNISFGWPPPPRLPAPATVANYQPNTQRSSQSVSNTVKSSQTKNRAKSLNTSNKNLQNPNMNLNFSSSSYESQQANQNPAVSCNSSITSKPRSNSSRSNTSKTKKTSSKKAKQNIVPPSSSLEEINLSGSIFETNRSITPYFGVPNFSPPRTDTPTYLPNNLINSTHRSFQNPDPSVTTTICQNFNTPLFTPRCQSNLNFNLSQNASNFGVKNMHPSSVANHMSLSISSNPVTSSYSPTPHFHLSNIFPDINNSNPTPASLSSIKFHHNNHLVPPSPGPQVSFESQQKQSGNPATSIYNSRHQSSALHNGMSINSILGNTTNPSNSSVHPNQNNCYNSSRQNHSHTQVGPIAPPPPLVHPQGHASFGNVLHSFNFSVQDH